MKTIRILYNQYLDFNGNKMMIGGVENYIRNLSIIFSEIGYKIVIYQFSDSPFEIIIDDTKIIGVGKHSVKSILKKVDEDIDQENDIVIFASDYLIKKNKYKKTIAIQHGVAWDITSQNNVPLLTNIVSIIKNMIKTVNKLFRYNNCKNIVCVDYNFINWYRTQVKNVSNNLFIIPNFAHVGNYHKKENKDKISIIFARRFVEYRGTKLFSEAIQNILDSYSNVVVTFAGEGPDEMWLKEKFKKYKNVNFTSFHPNDSIKVHSEYDIAVVPTIGSEGTSLSLLEAMSAGCAVIASDVGGMTNIILDQYNGLLIEPKKDELENSLKKLIEDYNLREELALNAYKTVSCAFSYDKWKQKWLEVIKKIDN